MLPRLLLRSCRAALPSLALPSSSLLRPSAVLLLSGPTLWTKGSSIAANMCDCGQKSSCCGGGQAAGGRANMSKEDVKATVREGYGGIAKAAPEKPSESAVHVAKSVGYTDADLASLPDGANMGLQCGNPTAMASLMPGERVCDLGSGGGLDVFLASKKVGPTGKAVGLDMTIDMIRRARAAAERGNYTNVEFVVGEMEKMPLPSGEFDCVISNCVVNLSPDKPAVFAEIFRILKPGGRVAISDMALRKPLPECIVNSVSGLIGCVAGALPLADYPRLLEAAGFERVEVVDAHANLNAYYEKLSAKGMGWSADEQGSAAAGAGCGCGCAGAGGPIPVDAETLATLRKYDANEYVASAKITAYKPAK